MLSVVFLSLRIECLDAVTASWLPLHLCVENKKWEQVPGCLMMLSLQIVQYFNTHKYIYLHIYINIHTYIYIHIILSYIYI